MEPPPKLGRLPSLYGSICPHKHRSRIRLQNDLLVRYSRRRLGLGTPLTQSHAVSQAVSVGKLNRIHLIHRPTKTAEQFIAIAGVGSHRHAQLFASKAVKAARVIRDRKAFRPAKTIDG